MGEGRGIEHLPIIHEISELSVLVRFFYTDEIIILTKIDMRIMI